jgi:hypothetical protein
LAGQANFKAQSLWPTAGSLPPNLYAWGSNSNGQLGLGNITNYSSPKQVGALSTWYKVSGGNRYTLAIKTDGTLWSWGQNTTGGRLGLGNETSYSSPKQVGSLTNWAIIVCGQLNSAAIKTDGTLWMWGYNGVGQLGLGNMTYYSSPKQVGALTTWAQISCGQQYHTVAIKTDGTLWSWGYNNSGQLGNGNTNNRSSPVQVGSLTNWLYIASGTNANIAVKTDGTLWSWGNNSGGTLGLGDSGAYTDRSSPVQVGALTTWSKPSMGAYWAMCTTTSGALWSWGTNADGQLGIGTTAYKSSPNQVGALTTWLTIASGTYSSPLALKTDGTLWAWGANASGQLGDGTVVSKSSPKQVGLLNTWTAVGGGNAHSIALT